jgi:hypothetical protein
MLPFSQKKQPDSQLVIDGTLNRRSNVRAKIEQDIAFLTDRLAAMREQPKPNNMLIEHYQTMLTSRESVLRWLLDGCDNETSYSQDQVSSRR